MAKAEKRGLEGPRLERYENQKAAAAKGPPWRVFRVIAGGPARAGEFLRVAKHISQSGNRKSIQRMRNNPL